jgi:hypothetical protein
LLDDDDDYDIQEEEEKLNRDGDNLMVDGDWQYKVITQSSNPSHMYICIYYISIHTNTQHSSLLTMQDKQQRNIFSEVKL